MTPNINLQTSNAWTMSSFCYGNPPGNFSASLVTVSLCDFPESDSCVFSFDSTVSFWERGLVPAFEDPVIPPDVHQATSVEGSGRECE